MFKGLMGFSFLRAISASFCGGVSIFLNLACILLCLFFFPSPAERMVILGLSVLIHLILIALIRLGNAMVSATTEIPLYEIDKISALALAAYILGAIASGVCLSGTLNLF